ncbi:hypothetical protein C7T94_04365 [Pedobacter yulinensis]|uniref:Uncharacterized protein n=1 Tax=Pedobacter yulinensis TaxID=2126353 RepID=A0A2T3HNE5_9SPHI|nr:hypothetical protein [Pedobacter yulinensis]PST83978.1 hypothetical protein C7T94_04365 [Pedobacter yulinensis]
MNRKSFLCATALCECLPYLRVGEVNAAPAVPYLQAPANIVTAPEYELQYDSFVYGALQFRIKRTFDDGPQRLLLAIRFEGSYQTFYEEVDIRETDMIVTFNEYSGPGFADVWIESITPI